jgi:tryptophan-rich sensory protein
MKTKIKPKLLALCLAVPLAVGAFSAYLSRTGMQEFAQTARQPALTPPPVVFIIVWTVLYLAMGAASYLVLRSRSPEPEVTEAMRKYGIQLAFNFFWSIFFFGMMAYLFSFIWLVGLWISIAVNLAAFYRISKPAGLLLVPYLLWVSFAGYLNLSVYLLNR